MAHGAEVVGQQLLDQLDDTAAVVAARDDVGAFLELGQGVGHGRRAPAQGEKGMIVLGVADADDAVRRQTQFVQRRFQSGGLVDAGGQHHDRVLVEDDVHLQSQVADRLQNGRLVRTPGRHDAAADGQRRDLAGMKGADKLRGRGWAQHFFLTLGGVVEQAAVLGDNAIEQIDRGANALEIVQFAAGDEEDLAAGFAQALDGGPGVVGHHAVVGQGAVVIGRESQVTHSHHLRRTPTERDRPQQHLGNCRAGERARRTEPRR